MSPLLLFIIIPVLTVIGIFFSKTHMQVKWTAALGMGCQLILAGTLIYLFLAATQPTCEKPKLKHHLCRLPVHCLSLSWFSVFL